MTTTETSASPATARAVWDGKSRLHLQGIGQVPAIPAGRLQVGMVTRWNYDMEGYEVVSIERSASGKTLGAVLRSRKDDKVWPSRKLLATRLVGVFLEAEAKAA